MYEPRLMPPMISALAMLSLLAAMDVQAERAVPAFLDLDQGTGGRFAAEIIDRSVALPGDAGERITAAAGAAGGAAGGGGSGGAQCRVAKLGRAIDDAIGGLPELGRSGDAAGSRLNTAPAARLDVAADIDRLGRGGVGSAFADAVAFFASDYAGAMGIPVGEAAGSALGPMGTLARGALGGQSSDHAAGRVSDSLFAENIGRFYDRVQLAGLGDSSAAGWYSAFGELAGSHGRDGYYLPHVGEVIVQTAALQRFRAETGRPRTGTSGGAASVGGGAVGSTGGFSDVIVPAANAFTFRIRDFSAEDGDRVALSLRTLAGREDLGTLTISNLGTEFSRSIPRGEASLRVTALNEGTLATNTGEVLILSPIISGPAQQRFTLRTGERGVLRIVAE